MIATEMCSSVFGTIMRSFNIAVPCYILSFTFTMSSPNPSNFKVTYSDSNRVFWIDGVEYGSGDTAPLVPDTGDVVHELKVEATDIIVVDMHNTYIDSTIDALSSWLLVGKVDLSNTNINTCSEPLAGWAATDISFNGCPLSIDDVDNIAEGLDIHGKHNGILDISNTNPPSNNGESYIDSLISKGWSVSYDANSGVLSDGSGAVLIDENKYTLIT